MHAIVYFIFAYTWWFNLMNFVNTFYKFFYRFVYVLHENNRPNLQYIDNSLLHNYTKHIYPQFVIIFQKKKKTNIIIINFNGKFIYRANCMHAIWQTFFIQLSFEKPGVLVTQNNTIGIHIAAVWWFIRVHSDLNFPYLYVYSLCWCAFQW